MAKKYILENEVERIYGTVKANDYLINGRSSKESKIEETVKNGTIIITGKQTKRFLDYIDSLSLEKAYQRIADDLSIEKTDSSRVIMALVRNKLVNYKKSENNCSLTKKGRVLKNGSNKKPAKKKPTPKNKK